MAEYTDARLESLLSSAIDRSLPDLLEPLSTAEVTRLDTPDDIVPTWKKPVRHTARRALAGLAASLVLVLGLGTFAFFRPQSVIGIDVNPSIELTANYFDRVLAITPLNEEAVSIIGDMNLKYVDLDIAVNALVGSMALHGYFESGQDVAVLVSVSGGSEDHNLTLQKKLAGDIEAAAGAAGASASVYTQNTGKASPVSSEPPASQSGVSYGKQVFIDKLLMLDPSLDRGELAAMPIGQIAALVKQRGLDLSSIVDYDTDDSVKENIEDFIDDLDDPDDDDGYHNSDDDRDDDDDDNDDTNDDRDDDDGDDNDDDDHDTDDEDDD